MQAKKFKGTGGGATVATQARFSPFFHSLCCVHSPVSPPNGILLLPNAS